MNFTSPLPRATRVLIPILLVLAILGGLIALAEGTVAGPFIYTLF